MPFRGVVDSAELVGGEATQVAVELDHELKFDHVDVADNTLAPPQPVAGVHSNRNTTFKE